MPFKFSWLCELLEELFQQRHRKRETYSKIENPDHKIINRWYGKYDDHIDRVGPSAVAFLSSLFPERRPDRVYNLQEKRLSQIFGRALGLGANRARVLHAWQHDRNGADFPSCVEQVMAECEFDIPRSEHQVTLEEIDEVLTQIAANSPYSSPKLKQKTDRRTVDELIAPIIQRLQSWEAKWLVRMLLKSYSPVEIPEFVGMHGFHFMLPKLLNIQNSLEAAVNFLSQPQIKTLPPRPSKEYEVALEPLLTQQIRPQLGVMIRRQPYWKARSIKHCSTMAEKRIMSVERKYDGEYCQIHIDLSKGYKCVQIFSKSGKDSTRDRSALLPTIKESVSIGQLNCKIRTGCILEGELVVWDKEDKRILPFYKIRNHVLHGGRRLGNEHDSPYCPNEQLMIVYYDLLMLNDLLLLHEANNERRSRLKALIRETEGSAQIVERQLIDFRSQHAPRLLREAFSASVRKRWEGFVLKGVNQPYYSWNEVCHAIKLKKDYIAGLGDVTDLCIVGGCRNPKIETELGLGKLSWTTFHIACLLNKEDVLRYDARPTLKVIDTLSHHSLSSDDIVNLNSICKMLQIPYSTDATYYTVSLGRKEIPVPTELFSTPLVVEIMGSGFERPSNCNFWVLRFPRKVGTKIKIHMDRNVSDTMSFDELQTLANESMTVADQSGEDAYWIQKLLDADPVNPHVEDKSQSTSPAKTPKSISTASLTTPGSSYKRKILQSPVLICTDACELTPAERGQRLSTATATTGSSEIPRCLKRKTCHTDGSPSEKVSPQRSKRIRSSISTTSPTSRSPTSPSTWKLLSQQTAPRSFTTSSGTSNILSEMVNNTSKAKHDRETSVLASSKGTSPGLGSQTVKQCHTRPMSGINTVHIHNPAVTVTLPKKSEQPPTISQQGQTKTITLPTPPSTAEQAQIAKAPKESELHHNVEREETDLEQNHRTSTSLPPTSKLQTQRSSRPQEVNSHPTLSSTQAASPNPLLRSIRPSISVPFHPPILIGASVTANKTSSQALWHSMRSVDASFTFSTTDFVNDINLRSHLPKAQPSQSGDEFSKRKTTRPGHLLLVDSENTQGANADLRRLARAMTSFRPPIRIGFGEGRINENRREPLVLVFDYKVLTIKAIQQQQQACSSRKSTQVPVIVDWAHLCANGGSTSIARNGHDRLFCGVADVRVQKGQGWAGRDAFTFEMKWEWNWLQEIAQDEEEEQIGIREE